MVRSDNKCGFCQINAIFLFQEQRRGLLRAQAEKVARYPEKKLTVLAMKLDIMLVCPL